MGVYDRHTLPRVTNRAGSTGPVAQMDGMAAPGMREFAGQAIRGLE